MKHNMKLRPVALALVALTLTFFLLIGATRQADAASCGRCCNCTVIHNFIVDELDAHQKWLVDEFWTNYLQPALSVMTNQINTGLTQQTASLGGFVDAQNNTEKRRVLQELQAQSANAYAPSEQLCRFATLSVSLAATEGKAKANRLIMSNRSLERQLGAPNTTASEGASADLAARHRLWTKRFCSANDNNGEMKALCNTGGDDRFLNADIDYVRTFDTKPTLNVDFTAVHAPTDDEKAIIALTDNLFASDLLALPKVGNLADKKQVKDPRTTYIDMRSMVAKRSVAENSFNTLVAMKSQGAPGSKEFIKNLLKELGLNDSGADSFLGGTPSYDAQMEVLTKKIYQTPNFYVNLVENPANVQRQFTAMQSFGLMQQRDIFDSMLRSEMILSLIVELEVAKYQDQAQAMMDRR